MSKKYVFLAAGALSLLVAASAQAITYTTSAIGSLSSTYGSEPVAMNDSGQVVGTGTTSAGASHAFITGANAVGIRDLNIPSQANSAADINAAGRTVGYATGSSHGAYITGENGVGISYLHLGGWSAAGAINTSGQVTGAWAATIDDAQYAFITDANGTGIRDLGALGGRYSYGLGINDSGQVIGLFDGGEGSAGHVFITGANGVGMRDLGLFGGISVTPKDINAAGQVVGIAFLEGGGYRAFMTGANGVGTIALGSLGGTYTGAYGINDAGQVVGGSGLAGNTVGHAFVTGANGVGMTDLNTLLATTLGDGIYLGNAIAINTSGQIVASDNRGRYYLLTPAAVPLPSSIWLMLTSVSGLGVLARKKLRQL